MEVIVELNPDIRGGYHLEYNDGNFHDETVDDLSVAKARQVELAHQLKQAGHSVLVRPMWHRDGWENEARTDQG